MFGEWKIIAAYLRWARTSLRHKQLHTFFPLSKLVHQHSIQKHVAQTDVTVTLLVCIFRFSVVETWLLLLVWLSKHVNMNLCCSTDGWWGRRKINYAIGGFAVLCAAAAVSYAGVLDFEIVRKKNWKWKWI